MTIKVKYFLFILLIHGLITYLVFLILEDKKGWFILSESLILISLFLSYQIYVGFIRPLEFMANGIDAINDEDFSVQYLKTNSKELNKLIDVYNQMIENIRDERVQIQQQNYFLQQVIEASPQGIIILDYDHQITQINPQATQILGIKPHEWLAQPLKDIDHPLIEGILKVKTGENSIVSGRGLERYKCEVSEFIHKGFRRRFIQLQELSKEILTAEKRAYGKVIRMMAHEVNNSMGATSSILSSVIEFFNEMEGEENALMQEALQTALNRNQSLNLFMRNFADVVRLPSAHLELKDLSAVVLEVSRFMQPKANELGISFQVDIQEGKNYNALLDVQQMEQAIVNIVKNAMEAIGENGNIVFHLQSQPLALSIRNDGDPISSEVQEQLFTPFFSTKPDGQGVGLTLIREIVMNHQASISLKTLEDGWTECKITF